MEFLLKNKKFQTFLLFTSFCLLFFVPRYFASTRYDALEDEILAIQNNMNYSVKEFIFAPDFTHPGFWYMLMDFPTSILGISHGIFYYRLIQVLNLLVLIIFAFFYFRKKLSNVFILIFFILFFTNIYLVHLTVQHRMYSLVLGLSIIYSFYWYHLFLKKNVISYKEAIYLGVLASASFFTNYSVIWLIPIWPLAYLVYKRSFPVLKKMSVFGLTILTCVGWFIPIFIKNANTSITHNQWTQHFSLRNFLQLIGNYFGLIPRNLGTNEINFFVLPFIFLFIFIIIWMIFVKKIIYMRYLFLSLLIFFAAFVFAVRITGNSLLYARTSIPFVVLVYVMIADSFIRGNKVIKFLSICLMIMQLFQFFIYFSSNKEIDEMYHLFDYKENTLGHFKKYKFEEGSCLIPIPGWNTTSAHFFLDKSVKVIATDLKDVDQELKKMSSCSKIYVLDQTSVDRTITSQFYQYFNIAESKIELVEVYINQSLYVLEN
ncbi:hypothetical protein KA111_02115 [Candidatus Woesebacteria bacterium]|nr:hypothetical protein [Candidatus Woesebacteria bacterium]